MSALASLLQQVPCVFPAMMCGAAETLPQMVVLPALLLLLLMRRPQRFAPRSEQHAAVME